jgi:hypothetical protein
MTRLLPSIRHSHSLRHARTLAVLAVVAGSAALGGCETGAPPPSPILSRLPADQTGPVNTPTPPPLTPEERARYDAIDRQVLFEQDQSIAAENAAQAWSHSGSPSGSPFYSPRVSVFGGYSSGGWGRGWGSGIGVGFGPGWGW